MRLPRHFSADSKSLLPERGIRSQPLAHLNSMEDLAAVERIVMRDQEGLCGLDSSLLRITPPANTWDQGPVHPKLPGSFSFSDSISWFIPDGHVSQSGQGPTSSVFGAGAGAQQTQLCVYGILLICCYFIPACSKLHCLKKGV